MRGRSYNYFEQDNIAERRAASPGAYGVHYDPESLLTGAEIAAGLTSYDKRVWPDEATYKEAVAGRIPVSEIPGIAPRVKILKAPDRLEELIQSGREQVARELAANGIHGPHETQRELTTQSRLETRLGAFYGADQVFTGAAGVVRGTGLIG